MTVTVISMSSFSRMKLPRRALKRSSLKRNGKGKETDENLDTEIPIKDESIELPLHLKEDSAATLHTRASGGTEPTRNSFSWSFSERTGDTERIVSDDNTTDNETKGKRGKGLRRGTKKHKKEAKKKGHKGESNDNDDDNDDAPTEGSLTKKASGRGRFANLFRRKSSRKAKKKLLTNKTQKEGYEEYKSYDFSVGGSVGSCPESQFEVVLDHSFHSAFDKNSTATKSPKRGKKKKHKTKKTTSDFDSSQGDHESTAEPAQFTVPLHEQDHEAAKALTSLSSSTEIKKKRTRKSTRAAHDAANALLSLSASHDDNQDSHPQEQINVVNEETQVALDELTHKISSNSLNSNSQTSKRRSSLQSVNSDGYQIPLNDQETPAGTDETETKKPVSSSSLQRGTTVRRSSSSSLSTTGGHKSRRRSTGSSIRRSSSSSLSANGENNNNKRRSSASSLSTNGGNKSRRRSSGSSIRRSSSSSLSANGDNNNKRRSSASSMNSTGGNKSKRRSSGSSMTKKRRSKIDTRAAVRRLSKFGKVVPGAEQEGEIISIERSESNASIESSLSSKPMEEIPSNTMTTANESLLSSPSSPSPSPSPPSLSSSPSPPNPIAKSPVHMYADEKDKARQSRYRGKRNDLDRTGHTRKQQQQYPIPPPPLLPPLLDDTGFTSEDSSGSFGKDSSDSFGMESTNEALLDTAETKSPSLLFKHDTNRPKRTRYRRKTHALDMTGHIREDDQAAPSSSMPDVPEFSESSHMDSDNVAQVFVPETPRPRKIRRRYKGRRKSSIVDTTCHIRSQEDAVDAPEFASESMGDEKRTKARSNLKSSGVPKTIGGNNNTKVSSSSKKQGQQVRTKSNHASRLASRNKSKSPAVSNRIDFCGEISSSASSEMETDRSPLTHEVKRLGSLVDLMFERMDVYERQSECLVEASLEYNKQWKTASVGTKENQDPAREEVERQWVSKLEEIQKGYRYKLITTKNELRALKNEQAEMNKQILQGYEQKMDLKRQAISIMKIEEAETVKQEILGAYEQRVETMKGVVDDIEDDLDLNVPIPYTSDRSIKSMDNRDRSNKSIDEASSLWDSGTIEYAHDIDESGNTGIITMDSVSQHKTTNSKGKPLCKVEYAMDIDESFQSGFVSMESQPREIKVKFNPTVKVTNTLSRHDMGPAEKFAYWCGDGDDDLTETMIEVMTDRWNAAQKYKQEQGKTKLQDLLEEMSPSRRVGAAIQQLLPANEWEGHEGYTYTIGIQD